MQKNKIKLIVLAGLTVILSGCATNIKNLASYSKAPLNEADILPTPAQMESKRTKVVVFDTDEDAVAQRVSGLGKVVSTNIESKLSESSVEIVDRNLAIKLRDEITLAEAKGSGNYSGPAVAQFAVKSFVGNVDSGSKYTQASTYCDKKGKCYVTPAKCTYSGSMSGGIRIYELPSLRLIDSFTLSGGASSSSESYCQNNSSLFAGLIRDAGANSVYSVRTELQNLFAPKGYIVEKRIFEDKVIFKVMVGKLQGVKSQNKLQVFTVRKETNNLTGKEEFEEMPLAEGIVSDQVSDNYSWIVISDKELVKRVRMGDYVKIKYNKGMFEF